LERRRFNGAAKFNLEKEAIMANSISTGVAYADPAVTLVQFQAYTVATVPSAATAGQMIYVSNGAQGDPIMAFSDGTNWLRVDTKAAIAAS